MEFAQEQEQEERNCETALRHMQAYCNNTFSGREVSLDDRRKLDRQYSLRSSLYRRQTNALNVLRQQQSRQSGVRTSKQSDEIYNMQQLHEKERTDLEQTLSSEVLELEKLLSQRKEQLNKRWYFEVVIWKHKKEQRESVHIPFPIAPVEWPNIQSTNRDKHTVVCTR